MLSRFSVVLISLAAVTTGNEVSISCEHDDTALLQLQSRGQPKHDPGALSEARNITFDKEFRAGLAQSIQDLKTGLTQAHLEKGAQVSADNFVHNIESVIALFDEEGEKIWDGDDVEGAPAPAEDDGRSLMDNAVDRVHAFKNLVGEDEGVKAVMGILVNQMYGHMRRLGQQGYANSAMNASMPKHKTVKNGKIPMGFVAQGAHALVTSSWPGDMCSMLNFPVLHPIMGALTLPLRFHPMLQIVCWELQFAEGLNMIPTALSGAVASSFALSPFIGMLASGLLTSSASMAGMVKANRTQPNLRLPEAQNDILDTSTLAQSGANATEDDDPFWGPMMRPLVLSLIRSVKYAMGMFSNLPRPTITQKTQKEAEVNVRVDVHQLSGQKKSSNYAGTSLKGPLGKGVMADIGANQNNGGNFLAFPSPAPIPTSPGQAQQQQRQSLAQSMPGEGKGQGSLKEARTSSDGASNGKNGVPTSSPFYSTVVRVTASQDNSHSNDTSTKSPGGQSLAQPAPGGNFYEEGHRASGAASNGASTAQEQLAHERMSLEREQQYAQSQPGYKASPEAAKAQQAPNSNNGALQPQEVQSFQQSMNEMEAVPVKISQAASASSKEAAMFNMMHPEKLFGRRKTTPMKESDMYKMMHPKESFAMPSGSTHKGSSEVKPTVAKRLKDELWLTQIT
eukprot:gnl/TRDRNA2_/TRDRNA2_175461_c0_seq15.p1 gnl/TRDRNA2_/TRDRNA2_175461_c0~~gnl/TRDRNA2_/TRDRNA2_175461_c0_seq15.p1  ORF type:complete len:678 (+),score=115.68 gnl/TRDRNA2_/TRDRNA2_175461_c0_seq15:52-2085(+)